MPDNSEEMLKAINEIRDLLRLMAEPAIAARDGRLRDELRQFVGKSLPKAKSVLLMDGSRSQREIIEQTQIHQGLLSVLVKKLSESNLLSGDIKKPKLSILIPINFFEQIE